METNTNTPEAKQPPSAGCHPTTCSALEFLAQELEMPADHLREIGRAMRDDKITEDADKLHQSFYTMKHDWKSGDFELPRLAEIHMEAIESKALELGKLLFRRQNAKEHPTT